MTDLTEMGKKAKEAAYTVQNLTSSCKNQVLCACAEKLRENMDFLLAENEKDILKARENGMHPGMIDRLKLTEERIVAMAEGLSQIASLPDPVGEVMDKWERPNGLVIEKCRVPLGVIGIIYESRPNVTADAFGLCFKAGNAVVLKGGSDALFSNLAIVKVLRKTLAGNGVTPDALSFIADTDRKVTEAFMKLNAYVDALIPRGGAGLIRSVVENSTIPVIETGTGNCHIYVDKDADTDMAVNIILNAKTQRIGVCNACESLVIHKDIREALLPKLRKALLEKHVEMRGDERIRAYVEECLPASEEDYGKEYLDYILSMKTVSDVEEAIRHINHYNTGHSESIITDNKETAELFLNKIDAACVYVNASTRFTDGFEFGFGAEIGISTQKLHARGPMGLKELTSYKYKIYGNGQIRQ